MGLGAERSLIMTKRKAVAYFINFRGVPQFWYIDSDDPDLSAEDCRQVRDQEKVELFALSNPKLLAILKRYGMVPAEVAKRSVIQCCASFLKSMPGFAI
jgi:hypothetical protein